MILIKYLFLFFIASEKVSENVHILANEPSLALYRIQENVRKVVPVIIEKRSDVEKLRNELNGICFDIDYSLETLKSIENADEPLKNIQESLKNAIFLRQQLKYEESRRKKDTVKDTSTIYKRFSAHLPLEIGPTVVVVRESVENMMGITNATPVTSTSSQAELQRSHTTLH